MRAVCPRGAGQRNAAGGSSQPRACQSVSSLCLRRLDARLLVNRAERWYGTLSTIGSRPDPLLAFNSANRDGAVLLGRMALGDVWTGKSADSGGLVLQSGYEWSRSHAWSMIFRIRGQGWT